jgi:hypothetical protein
VSLRTKHPPIAKNFLRIGNFYSAFKTVDRPVDCHFVILLSVPVEPVGFSLSITSILGAGTELVLIRVIEACISAHFSPPRGHPSHPGAASPRERRIYFFVEPGVLVAGRFAFKATIKPPLETTSSIEGQPVLTSLSN